MSRWIDITRAMDETLVTWPGRPRPHMEWEKRIASTPGGGGGGGDHCNVSRWQMSAHAGTHMDAPLHFVDGGKTIDQVPPEVFIGECRIVDLPANNITILDETTARRFVGAKRLLVKTPHSVIPAAGHYEPHDGLMTEAAAMLLLTGGLVLIGTDRLSVDDSRGESFVLHRRFLGSGCVIVEGLALAGIAEGAYDISATPLRLTGAEASPIRALLRLAEPPR